MDSAPFPFHATPRPRRAAEPRHSGCHMTGQAIRPIPRCDAKFLPRYYLSLSERRDLFNRPYCREAALIGRIYKSDGCSYSQNPKLALCQRPNDAKQTRSAGLKRARKLNL